MVMVLRRNADGVYITQNIQSAHHIAVNKPQKLLRSFPYNPSFIHIQMKLQIMRQRHAKVHNTPGNLTVTWGQLRQHLYIDYNDHKRQNCSILTKLSANSTYNHDITLTSIKG